MIKDIRPGRFELKAVVAEVKPPRSFTKFGREGVVIDILLKDKTGEITLVLFEDIGLVKKQKVRVIGFAKEYKGTLQLYLGRVGSIEVIANI